MMVSFWLPLIETYSGLDTHVIYYDSYLILLRNVSKPWKNWKKIINKICKPFTRPNTSEHLAIQFFICIYDTYV